MRKITIILSLLVLGFSGCKTQKINQTMFDERVQKTILIGNADRNGLQIDPFNSWFASQYESYSVDKLSLEELNLDALLSTQITIVMGTWCGDSKREVPRFYKILDYLDYDYSMLKVIAVDRAKTGGKLDISELKIERVPTFIFYKDNEEIGRIIETPEESLEKDLARIVK